MVSIVDFSPLDMSNFFRDVMALSRGHPKTFYVYWHEFRDIMITNTRLRVGDSVRNCEENRYGNYERMAYHEYLLERGVSMENITAKSIYIPRNEIESNNDCKHEFKVTKFPNRTKNHLTRVLDSTAKCNVDKVSEAQRDDFSILLIASRFMELSDEEFLRVQDTFSIVSDETVLIEKFNVQVTRRLLKCLDGYSWLNDEIVNFSMSMLQERDATLCKVFDQRVSSHYYNSFFMNKLMDSGDGSYCYDNVKRWSKKFNIFEKNKIFCPINLKNTHWTMLVIYVQEKKIKFYDSMASKGTRYLNGALQYLQDESIKRNGANFNLNEWELISTTDKVPQQENGFDCGVFTIMYADFITDDLPLKFSQNEMPLFRRKICANVLRGSINYPLINGLK